MGREGYSCSDVNIYIEAYSEVCDSRVVSCNVKLECGEITTVEAPVI